MGEWKDNSQTNQGTGEEEGGLDVMLLAIVGGVLLLIIVGTLMFMRRGGEKEDAFIGMEGGFGGELFDPTEQYVQ
jgi:hypothetical protein